MATPSTFAGPRARAARHATSAESMPPESPAARARSRSGARSRACRARARPAPTARQRVRPDGDRRQTPRSSSQRRCRRRRDRLAMLGRARDDLAGGVEREAGAVEHQVVLPADLVDEHQRAAPAARGRRQHARAQVALLDRERRRRDVDDDLGAGAHQRLDRIGAVEPRRPEVGVVPDVLADRDPQAPAAKEDGRDLGGRRRSSATRRTRRRSAAATCARRAPPGRLDQRGAVGEAAPVGRRRRARGSRRAPRSSPPAARRRQRVERGAGRLDEGGPLEQVLGRIAAERQLGEDRQLRAARLGRGQGVQHQPAVPVEVADGGIDLPERDLHVVYSTGRAPGVRRDKMNV